MSNKLRVSSVILSLACVAASAFGQTANQDSIDRSAPQMVVVRDTSSVPLLPSPTGDVRPTVNVMVNGRGPYRFLIETGAPFVGINEKVAKELNLDPTIGADSIARYEIDSMTVGTTAFQKVHVLALPPGGLADGLLGLPFYKNVLLTIDFPARRVRFERDTLPSPNGRNILKLGTEGPFWSLPLLIGGLAFNGVVDTQSSGGLSVPPRIADSLAFDGELRVIGKARGAFGTVDVKGGTLKGDVVLGGYTLTTPFLSILQLPPPLPGRPNIGSRIFENFAFTLDQRRGRLRLDRSGPNIIPAPPRPTPPAASGSASTSATDPVV